jgi:hypothetical protein
VPSFRSPLLAAAAAGLVAVLAGCAGVPDSGSVHLGRTLPGDTGSETTDIAHVVASGPVAGMSPTSLVTGFLGALVDSDDNYEVARLFLVPGTNWQTTTGTTLYDRRSAVQKTGPKSLSVTLRRVGTVDPRGSYQVAPGTVHARFTVTRLDGQWRISHLPDGLLLSISDVQRTLQPASIFFFNRNQTRLVPVPILVPPDEPGLATTLIHELVSGPSRRLAPAVSTAIPSGTDLVGNVPIDTAGVASVDLAGGVQQESANALEHLSAQVVWTLRQLPTVTAVRLLVNGAPLSITGVAKVQPIGSWPQFDPETPPTTTGALLSDEGRVVDVGGRVPTAFTHRSLASPAISADGATVAALRRHGGRTTLLVGPAEGPLRGRWSAANISGPSFGPQGQVLVVVGTGARARILEVPKVGRVRRVAVPRTVRGQGISQLAVSRDGSRVALVVGPPGDQELLVGGLARTHGTTSVVGSALVIAGTQDVQGIAWAGANELVTTVRESARRRVVVETPVDGYQPETLPHTGLPSEPTQVAAAPGQPVLAGADGAVWMSSGSRWDRVRSGSDPSYAG